MEMKSHYASLEIGIYVIKPLLHFVLQHSNLGFWRKLKAWMDRANDMFFQPSRWFLQIRVERHRWGTAGDSYYYQCLCCTWFVHKKRIWISWAVNMSYLTSACWLGWPLKATNLSYNLESLFADYLFPFLRGESREVLTFFSYMCSC